MESFKDSLENGIHHKRSDNGGLISTADLKEIWTDSRLNEFNEVVLKGKLAPVDTEFVREHLLKTISLLILAGAIERETDISVWDNISGNDWDAKLHLVKDSDLLWLNGTQKILFYEFRYIFTVLVVNEGEDYTLESYQKMPLIEGEVSLSSTVSLATIGIVKQRVARGYLKLKRNVSQQSCFRERI